MILGFVWSVAKTFWRTNILRKKLVPIAVERFSPPKSEKVYNLTLVDHNVYYANGILVENCAIALEGARQRGFNIARMANKEDATASKDWFYEKARQRREEREKHQLNYSV